MTEPVTRDPSTDDDELTHVVCCRVKSTDPGPHRTLCGKDEVGFYCGDGSMPMCPTCKMIEATDRSCPMFGLCQS